MDLQYPVQSYYPSVKVRLIIRFDEFASSETVSGRAPKKIITKLKGVKDSRSNVDVVPDPAAPPGVTRYLLKPADGDAPGGPQKEDSSADQLTHVIGGIIPSRCELGLNGIRTADTAKIVFRYLDLPIDPRLVRSCAIEIYMGCVSEADFRAGIQGGVRGSSGNTGDGEPLNVIPDTYVDEAGQQRTNLRFQGWVDEWEVEYQEDGEPTVSLSCRDNTQLLIDTDAPAGLVLAVKDPVDKAIATYLSNFPTFAGLTVEYRPGGVKVPVLEGQLAKTAYNPKTGGATPSKGGGTSKLSTWDYLTDIIGAIGHTIRLEGTQIIIQQARTMLSNDALKRPDDPYKRSEKRLMVYGRNVSNLKFGRKFGRATTKNIEVVCYSSRQKMTLVERFPSETSPLVTRANPGDGHNEVAYQVIKVHGIEDRGTLKLIAQSMFEQLGRNEIAVSFETKNLASFGGGNEDPDLLDLRAGDTIDVQVNQDDAASACALDAIFQAQTRATEFLTSVGYSTDFANAAAKAATDAGFQTTFKVKAANFSWTIDEGIRIAVSAVNYIEVRVDPKWQGQEPEKGTSAQGDVVAQVR